MADVEKMQEQIEEIHTALLGGLDGKPGILTRLDRLENHNKLIAAATAPGIAIVLKKLWDVIIGG